MEDKEETTENSQLPETPSQNEQQQSDTDSQQEPPAEPQQPEQVSKDAKNMAMLSHLLGFFTSFFAPLIIWLLKKDEEPFVDQQAKEALNFQITILLAMCAAALLSIICVGIPLLIVIPILDLIFCIIAAVKSSDGQPYRYPVCLRLVK